MVVLQFWRRFAAILGQAPFEPGDGLAEARGDFSNPEIVGGGEFARHETVSELYGVSTGVKQAGGLVHPSPGHYASIG